MHLPNFDRLRSEAIEFTNVIEAGRSTQDAIPSLLLGKKLTTKPTGPNSLLLVHKGRGFGWSDAGVIETANSLGYRTGLVGWYHPYCRILGGALAHCAWLETSMATPASAFHRFAEERGVGKATPVLLEAKIVPWRNRKALHRDFVTHADVSATLKDSYERLVERYRTEALAAVEMADLDFLILHAPLPHLPGLGKTGTYIENVILADQFLGDVRRTLEKQGLWDKTNVLVTSDHGFRTELWSESLDLLSEPSRRVPFLLRMAGGAPARLDRQLSAVRTRELLEGMMRSEIRTEQDVRKWLEP